jgi:uncharacterized surface protein with fasciclin (FAS1) repeats
MRNKIFPLHFVLVVFALASILSGCVKSNTAGPTVFYPIDKLVSEASNLSILNSVMMRTGLDSQYYNNGPYTIFVATDTAWALAGLNASVVSSLPDSQLSKIIMYNTISGSIVSTQFPAGPNALNVTLSGDSVFITHNTSGVFVNGINMIVADLVASNGVIDAMNQQLLPPAGTLMQIIQADTTYGYFSAAISRTSAGQTNVNQILTSGGIYTVFMPTNDAFRSAGYTTVDSINNTNPDSLATLLTYHILPGRVFSSDFLTGQIQKTLQGDSLFLNVLGGIDYTAQGLGNTIAVQLIKTNIMAHNGVIHSIGELLLP